MWVIIVLVNNVMHKGGKYMSKFIVVVTDLDCTKECGTYIVDAENKDDAKSKAEIFLPGNEEYKYYVISAD